MKRINMNKVLARVIYYSINTVMMLIGFLAGFFGILRPIVNICIANNVGESDMLFWGIVGVMITTLVSGAISIILQNLFWDKILGIKSKG